MADERALTSSLFFFFFLTLTKCCNLGVSADWATEAKQRAACLFVQRFGYTEEAEEGERRKKWIWEQMAPLENGWRVWIKLKQNELYGLCFLFIFFMIELGPGDYYQGTEVKVLWHEALCCSYPCGSINIFHYAVGFGVRYPPYYNITASILRSSQQLFCFDDTMCDCAVHSHSRNHQSVRDNPNALLVLLHRQNGSEQESCCCC